MRRTASWGLLLVMLVGGCTSGPPTASATLGGLEISGGFAYEPITLASGAAYFTVENVSATPDTLLSITTTAAASAMLHGGSMTHLATLPIPSRATVTLAPGGTHLMISDFTTMPKAGDSLPVTLRFSYNGTITLLLPVRKYGE